MPKSNVQKVGNIMNKVGNAILTAGSISDKAPMTHRAVGNIERAISSNQTQVPKKNNTNNKNESVKEEDNGKKE